MTGGATEDAWRTHPIVKAWLVQCQSTGYCTPDDVEMLRGSLELPKYQMHDFLVGELLPELGRQGVKYRNRRLSSGSYAPPAVTELPKSRVPFNPPACVRSKSETRVGIHRATVAGAGRVVASRPGTTTSVGYDCDGYDPKGYDRGGYDREGFNREGYDRQGYNRRGQHRPVSHRAEPPAPAQVRTQAPAAPPTVVANGKRSDTIIGGITVLLLAGAVIFGCVGLTSCTSCGPDTADTPTEMTTDEKEEFLQDVFEQEEKTGKNLGDEDFWEDD